MHRSLQDSYAGLVRLVKREAKSLQKYQSLFSRLAGALSRVPLLYHDVVPTSFLQYREDWGSTCIYISSV